MFLIEHHYYDEYMTYGYVATEQQAKKVVAAFKAWQAQLEAINRHRTNVFNKDIPAPALTLTPPFWDEFLFEGEEMPLPGQQDTVELGNLRNWMGLYVGYAKLKPLKLLRKPRQKKRDNAAQADS